VRTRVGVLTVSDGCARGEREDESGARIVAWCVDVDVEVSARAVVEDATDAIVPVILEWADRLELDVLLTTGGTGLTPRDVTPEATRAVLHREAPGIAEALRRRGAESTPFAALSRGLAGARGRTLIVNLPGSLSGVEDGLAVLTGILPHAVRMLRGRDTAHEPHAVGKGSGS